MCDYSLQNVKTRPAEVGDKLNTRDFGTGPHGFAASEDASVAVCVLPGTELAFANEVVLCPNWYGWHQRVIKHKTAIFRQINLEKSWAHHDALEFPDGQIVLLTCLMEGQEATVLQLPAAVGSRNEQHTSKARVGAYKKASISGGSTPSMLRSVRRVGLPGAGATEECAR